jgi:gluconolactonase
MPEPRILADGLKMPEGPLALPDGSLLVGEMEGEQITRIDVSDGRKTVIAKVKGAPNGMALGPDGRVYVCNNGGSAWTDYNEWRFPHGVKPDWDGGSLQVLDLDTGEVETLFRDVDGRRLSAPNDLVFDASGGLWFTDFGKERGDRRDIGHLCYLSADGTTIRDVLTLMGPNGIGLSPDGDRLYVAHTDAGMVQWWPVVGPGEIEVDPRAMPPGGGNVVFRCSGADGLDSLAVDAEGAVHVATLFSGAFTIIPADGGTPQVVPVPDPLPTNVCFAGPGLQTAYATLAATGRVATWDWPVGGTPLNFGVAPAAAT